jgi:hypothetical protein
MKKTIFYMIVVAIVTMLLTSASSLNIKQVSPQEEDIQAEYLVVQGQPLLKTKTIEKPIQPLLSGSASITGGNYNEYHPSIARSPAGGFYAMVEESTDGVVWNPTMYRSVDGVVWNSILTTPFSNAEYTDMDQNAYGTYGTFGAPPYLGVSDQIIIVKGEIADGWVWDYEGFNLNEFSNNRIACYTLEGPEGDPGTWNWGGISFTGYQGYSSPHIVGCPFIFYQNSATTGSIGWLTGSVSGCEHVGSTMDLAKNIMYSVYDRNTGTAWELLLRKDNFGVWNYIPLPGDYWTHQYMASMHITDPADLTYPSVAAYNDTVIIACQKGNNVTVYYSNDGFSTYSEVLVQALASYPEVTITDQGIAIITYIKDNVLYYRISDNGGASWSNVQIVSDNHVNLNDRAANLDEYNGNVFCTWEDNRGANIDAYFDTIYGTPPVFGTPNPVNGSTGNPVSFPWSIPINDSDGDQFSWTIQCNNGQTNSGTNATNGTKTLALSGLTYSTTYKVWVNATDPTGSGLYTRKWYTFATKQNTPPSKPERPSGLASGKINVEYTYTTKTVDSNGDQVYYWWDWGDSTNSGWVGSYSSNVTTNATHIWTVKGSYSIKVKAKDTSDAESPWSDPLPITMPVDVESSNALLLKKVNQSPNAFPLLRRLLIR